jgi:hypothetical protein
MSTQPQTAAGPDWHAVESVLNFAGQRGDVDCITVIDDYEAQVKHLTEQVEAARVRLWLIEQTLQRVDASDDPAGIVGDLGPYLDGPLHPTHIAAYHAARSGQQEYAAAYPTHHVDGTPSACGELHPDTTACVLNNDHDHPHDDGQGNQWTGRAGRRNARSLRARSGQQEPEAGQ